MDITEKISDILALAPNVDAGVNAVLEYLGASLNISRMYVFETSDDGEYINNTYEWCAEGITPEIARLQNMSVVKYGYDKFFADSDMFNCPEIESLPEATREELRSQNIKAMMQCALLEHGTFRGFVGIDDCARQRPDWRTDSPESRQLRFVARLLSMYLLKERSMQKLAQAKDRALLEQATRAAAGAQQNLDLINDIIGSGMWYFNYNQAGERVSVSWSDKFRHMLGFENEQDFPNTFEAWADRLHPDDRAITLERYEQGVKGEREYDVKYRVKKKNGEYEWFSAHGKAIYYPNGKPRMFAGTFINITMAENLASDINGRMAAVLGGIRGGLKISTPAAGYPYTYISEEVAALQGCTVPELLAVTGGSALKNVMPQDRARVDTTVRSQLAHGTEHSVKYRVRHKDGSVRWVHDFGRKIIMPDSTELIYSLIQDITEERILTMRLESEQKQYREALTKNALYTTEFDVTDGYMREEIVDRSGRHRLAELGLSLPCRYDVQCSTYREKYDLEFFDDRAPVFFSREGLIKIYAEGTTSEYIEYYRRADKAYIRVLMLLTENEANGHIHATAIGFDVTDVKKAELEKQRVLKEALAQAERANLAKTTFLNNMSHDIRTPMNAVIGFTALASTHVDDREKVLDYLKKIQISSNHLLSLINDVLDMSRIESGKVKIEQAQTSLPEVIHDLKNIVQADVHSKQLELFFDTVDVTDENVWCDRLRLSQVLLNCMSNAIKFTPAGGTIGLRVTQLPSSKPGWAAYEFKIRDTGIGMSQEFIGRIFEPFERENTSTVSGILGTGLGMSITKNIVDMMGGNISVASEKGKGSEFTISLSFKLAGEGAHDYTIPALKSVHALVADDSFDTCTSVSAMLRKIGLRPEWTMTGKEAVLRAHDAGKNGDPFGVYIIDWLMPDLNGIEVVRRIRAEIGDDTPIIILTAYDWGDIEDDARAAGVTAFCSKPMFMSELCSLLGGAAQRPERVPTPEPGSLDGVSILLVEDNDMNREIAGELLTGLGAEVDYAEDGALAVERVKSSSPGRYDIILMDVQMPVMNGYEATRLIRALPAPYTQVPIIAMTANAFEEDRKAAMAAGMDGYIAKPIDVRNIAAAIKEHLK